jgi:hypothetical protein
VSWQHFFNLFFMVFIIRSGIQILSDHPRLYWTGRGTKGARGRPAITGSARTSIRPASRSTFR